MVILVAFHVRRVYYIGMRKRKPVNPKFILLVGIFLIVVVYWLVKSTSSVSLQKYTNSNVKFELTYPQTWKVETSPLPFTTLVTFSHDGYSFHIYTYEIKNARDYVTSDMKGSEKVSINGLETYHLHNATKGDSYMIFDSSTAYFVEMPQSSGLDGKTAEEIVQSIKHHN
ncbi:hypothetical protein BH09PAT2_BH09PAT2_09540 [soil metagenome]